MSDIFIEQNHSLGADRAREEVDKALAKMAEKMGLEVSWSGDSAALRGKGIKKASVKVTDDTIVVDIDLSLFARPMKGMIEEKIRQRFAGLA